MTLALAVGSEIPVTNERPSSTDLVSVVWSPPGRRFQEVTAN
jgi:hypothetical protein